ncbi:riboflavin biosynthesis protein RibF [Enterococcus sp. CSURQ0835]|uniref:riboflavin biosynthesis protein RibF n=1 Tax=Enterococcus sp. CSURQ0835 TaxID=2681394 RepID=UPI001356D916|nr:riboflavin biosynthesis protein RibF [Enterococcus sp. CSURQ0835]
MKTIKLRHPYQPQQIPAGDVVLVLGFFDGVHRGHQQVIATGKKIAAERGLQLAVMTFNQHPAVVFQKFTQPIQYLSTLNEKEMLMEKCGVDLLYEVAFTSSFAGLSPQAFVDQYIVGLHAQVVVAGFDYTYGKKAVASVAQLPEYAHDRFETVVVDKLEDQGEKVSSTRIRQLLLAGKVETAAELLGYVYQTPGVVIHGDARGRELGFPTANIQVAPHVLLPKEGVYACELQVGGKWYQAMGSIGHNDTFGPNRELTVEINILDFDEAIYGEEVAVSWNAFLREQVAFDSADALITQLKADKQATREYFERKINFSAD